MKQLSRYLVQFTGSLLIVLAATIILTTGKAFAAERVWTGAGGNNNLATAGNWQGGVAPGNGDSLSIPYDVLFASCSDVSLYNDINPGNVTLAGISFTGSKPENCYSPVSISGNTLRLSGNFNGGLNYVRYDAPIVAMANLEIRNVYSTSTLDIGSHSVTLSQRAGGFSAATGSGTLILGEAYQAGGGGCGDGQGRSYPIAGDGSGFSGEIISNDIGISVSSRGNDIARHASQITINSGGSIGFSLNYHEDMSFAGKLILNGGIVAAGQSWKSSGNDCLEPTAMKNLNLTGQVQINQPTVFNPYTVNIVLGNQTTGADKVSVADGVTGKVTLPSGSVVESKMAVHTIDNTESCIEVYAYTGHKSIVNVDCSDRPVIVGGGILGGVGKVGRVEVMSDGIIAPGNSPGTLSTGDLEFEEGGIYEFELAGNGAGEYDQINVTGTVNLGNGTLRVLPLNNFTPSQGQQYTIINNDGEDAVEGTFAGLAEGATVEVNGAAWFTISYVGGDGNDVVLTAIPGVGDAGNETQTSLLPVLTVTAAAVIGLGFAAKRRVLGRR